MWFIQYMRVLRVFTGYHSSDHHKSRAEFSQQVTLTVNWEWECGLIVYLGRIEKAWILVSTGIPSLVLFASNALISGQ